MTAASLETHDDALPWTLTLRDDAGGTRSYDCTFIACDSPFCCCTDVDLHLSLTETAWNGRVELNLETNSPSEPRPDRPLSSEEQELAETLADALDDDAWDSLWSAFLAVKERAIASVDPSAAVVGFDFDGVESGDLVPYVDVFAFAPPLDIVQGHTNLAAVDYYCLKADCACERVVIELRAVRHDDQGVVVEPEHVLELDYRKRRWADPETGAPLRGPALAVQRALVAQHPDIASVFAARHRVMKELYRTSARHRRPDLFAPVAAAPAVKVGRNDPCPCGSGHKFKRCCGR